MNQTAWEIEYEQYVDIEDAVNAVIFNIDESEYNTFLHTKYGYISICGIRYSAESAFELVDPIMYDYGFEEYKTDCYDSIKKELIEMEVRDSHTIHGTEVTRLY